MIVNHTCIAASCGEIGPFGVGDLRKPETVRWFCRAHLPDDFYGSAAPVMPSAPAPSSPVAPPSAATPKPQPAQSAFDLWGSP
jgi:hypothetical protein